VAPCAAAGLPRWTAGPPTANCAAAPRRIRATKSRPLSKPR